MNKYNNDLHNKTIFGFWLYIMSDCVLFASLFAIYSTLNIDIISLSISNKNLFDLNFVFIETCCLLLSSITYSKAMEYTHTSNEKKIQTWMIITFILGSFFIYMEIYEFYHLIELEYTPQKNAFFSSFFILVGTHGLHVFTGLIWIIIMLIHLQKKGLTHINITRLQCLSLFWHFLDIVWICLFTEVYLMGSLHI